MSPKLVSFELDQLLITPYCYVMVLAIMEHTVRQRIIDKKNVDKKNVANPNESAATHWSIFCLFNFSFNPWFWVYQYYNNCLQKGHRYLKNYGGWYNRDRHYQITIDLRLEVYNVLNSFNRTLPNLLEEGILFRIQWLDVFYVPITALMKLDWWM